MEMIEPPIDPPESYWGYEEEEKDYSLDLSKIDAEDKLQPYGGQAPLSTIPTPILLTMKEAICHQKQNERTATST